MICLGSLNSTDLGRRGFVFIFVQTTALLLFAVWSLGGRAEGALNVIGYLGWSSLLCAIFDTSLRQSIIDALCLKKHEWLVYCWGALILILLLAPFNAEWNVETTAAGNVVMEAQSYDGFLPTTFIEERCRDYGLLLSGLMVQAMVLWHVVRTRRILRWLLTFLAAHAIVVALVGAYFRLTGSDLILGLFEPVHSGFFASFRYHNHWTAFAILSMGQCLALALYWYRRSRRDLDLRRKRPDWLWAAGLIFISLTLPLAFARAGVLLLILFWLALALWAVLRPNPGVGVFRRFMSFIAVPAFSLALLAYSIWGARHGLNPEWRQTLAQLAMVQSGEYEELDSPRTDTWGDGWRQFKDRPLFGHGYGSHRYLYQMYARDEYRYESGIVRHIKEFAHNDWMQYLAELGIVGMLCLLLPPLVLALRYYDILFVDPIGTALCLPLGLLALLASFEFPFSNPAVLTIVFIHATLAFKSLKLKAEIDTKRGMKLKLPSR